MTNAVSSVAEVYRTHDVYAGFAQEHRQAGSVPVEFIRIAQGPFEATDPTLNVMLLGVTLTPTRSGFKVNFGEGRHQILRNDGSRYLGAYLNPTLGPAEYAMDADTDLMFLAAPLSGLAGMLEMEVTALNAAFRPLYDHMVHDPLVRHLALSMCGMASKGGAQASLYVDQALITLALHLAAVGRGTDWRIGADLTLGDALHGASGALDAVRLARVLDHVEAHIAAPLTVNDLATVACLSPQHFIRAFKAATGQTPHRHVMARRLERAREGLIAADDDLTTVALACGFASHAHLSTSFKARFGVTPSAWRGMR